MFDYQSRDSAMSKIKTNTLNPSITGAIAMAVSFNEGVVLASDRSAFFSTMHRFNDVSRHFRLNDRCVVVFSGDFADFQWIKNLIVRRQMELQQGNIDFLMSPKMLHSFLTTLFYGRRSKMNPLWNTVIVCGMEAVPFEAFEYEPFIGVVNLYGIAFEGKFAATEIGLFLLRQMLENRRKEELSREEAVTILKEAMEVSLYRNTRTGNNFDLTIIDKDGVKNTEITGFIGDWEIAEKYKNISGKF
ncbi:Proteasome subunit beta [Meloidogyne graminicola]|uniref:Proteasome subunit beta n=1 Tax=Meloidogyne graminicola TaxID=189291 RepID=A0A8T0A0C9_9BILA|nr:Proteasome subunit beta [Meloidogyne graminicola]